MTAAVEEPTPEERAAVLAAVEANTRRCTCTHLPHPGRHCNAKHINGSVATPCPCKEYQP